MKISFVCIGHNEKAHLEELLPQLLRWSEDVIYVDCDSADESYEYASSLKDCRCFRRPNHHNLNVNKAYAIDQAQGDWIFYIDPDERLSESLFQELQSQSTEGQYQAFKLSRKNHFFGVWLKRGGQYPDTQLRFFKKGCAEFPQKHVHESLLIHGSTGRLSQPMSHFPYKDVSQYLRKFDFYSSLEAEYLWKAGVRPSWANHIKYFWWKPHSRFFRRYFLKRGFLDGVPGFFAAFFDAMGWVTRYFKLWQLHNKSSVAK